MDLFIVIIMIAAFIFVFKRIFFPNITISIKTYYQFTWKVQRFIIEGSNNKIFSFLKRYDGLITLILLILCFACLWLFAYTHIIIFAFIAAMLLITLIIISIILKGYETTTSITYFFKRAVPMLIFFWYIACTILLYFYINQQINGYLFYFTIVFVLCLLWFFVISHTSLKVMEMIGKLLKGGIAFIGAIWASMYAFVYVQSPSFIARAYNIDIDVVNEELSKSPPNDLIMSTFFEPGMLEVLQASIPIIVLPFLLIVIVTEVTYNTKNYWVEKYNNNQDITFDAKNPDKG